MSADDPRMSDTHVCYTCLLDDKEEALLEKLRDLTLKRRVAHALFTGTFKYEQELARTISM